MTDVIAAQPATDLTAAPLDQRFERYRAELTARCRRMLGSTFDAEDAVQETFIRAWRGLGRFEGRSSLRTWLHRIAANICLDMLRKRGRTPPPADLLSLSATSPGKGQRRSAPLTEALWSDPPAGGQARPAHGDPADVVVEREDVELAFLALLLHLPPRQRAVLILREALRWSASDTADLLGTTVAAVNSALQRARATLADCPPPTTGRPTPGLPHDPQNDLLTRSLDAFTRYDAESLTSLVASPTAPRPTMTE